MFRLKARKCTKEIGRKETQAAFSPRYSNAYYTL
jgi:hypothetical protein